mgnify:CR=1 FL=1
MSKQQGGCEEGGAHTPVGTRRTFFGWVTKVAAGLIGLGLAIPLTGYVISPALKRKARPWVDGGSLEDVPPGDPKQLDQRAESADASQHLRSHRPFGERLDALDQSIAGIDVDTGVAVGKRGGGSGRGHCLRRTVDAQRRCRPGQVRLRGVSAAR